MEQIEPSESIVDGLSEVVNQFYGWRLLQAVLAIRRSGFPVVQAAFIQGNTLPEITSDLLRLCEPQRDLENVLWRVAEAVENGWVRAMYSSLRPFVPPAD